MFRREDVTKLIFSDVKVKNNTKIRMISTCHLTSELQWRQLLLLVDISSDYVDTFGISTRDMEVSEILFTFEYLYLYACLFLCNGN